MEKNKVPRDKLMFYSQAIFNGSQEHTMDKNTISWVVLKN